MTKNLVTHQSLIDFEAGIEGNIRTYDEGADSLSSLFDLKEAKPYKVILGEPDVEAVFLCHAPNLERFTENQTFQLKDVLDADASSEKRVSDLLAIEIDLSSTDAYAPVFISPNIDTDALVAIDGNHRLVAHFLKHRNLEGVHAYVFEHPGTIGWKWFPPEGKRYKRELE